MSTLHIIALAQAQHDPLCTLTLLFWMLAARRRMFLLAMAFVYSVLSAGAQLDLTKILFPSAERTSISSPRRRLFLSSQLTLRRATARASFHSPPHTTSTYLHENHHCFLIVPPPSSSHLCTTGRPTHLVATTGHGAGPSCSRRDAALQARHASRAFPVGLRSIQEILGWTRRPHAGSALPGRHKWSKAPVVWIPPSSAPHSLLERFVII